MRPDATQRFYAWDIPDGEWYRTIADALMHQPPGENINLLRIYTQGTRILGRTWNEVVELPRSIT